MNQAAYTALIHGICAIAGIDDPAPLIESGQLAVDGHLVSLHYDEDADPKHLRVQVDLGGLQPAEREEMYRSALEANFHIATARDGVIGLDPQSGRLHYVLFFPLDGSRDATDLMGTIMELLDDDEAA